MSSFRRPMFLIMYLLCPILLFLMGMALIVYEWFPGLRAWLDSHFVQYLPDYAPTVWGAFLIFIPLSLLLLSFRRSGVLVFKTDSGQPLKIRESAVSRYIYDRLMSLPNVKSARVSSRSKGGALALKVSVWVACRKPLDNLQQQVLDHIVQNARKGFGISKILPPDVQFESVKVSKAVAGEPESAPAERESAPEEIFAFGSEPARLSREVSPAPDVEEKRES